MSLHNTVYYFLFFHLLFSSVQSRQQQQVFMDKISLIFEKLQTESCVYHDNSLFLQHHDHQWCLLIHRAERSCMCTQRLHPYRLFSHFCFQIKTTKCSFKRGTQSLFIAPYSSSCIFPSSQTFHCCFWGGLLCFFIAHAAPHLSLGNHHLLFTTSLSTSFRLFFSPTLSHLSAPHTHAPSIKHTYTHTDAGPFVCPPASFKPFNTHTHTSSVCW